MRRGEVVSLVLRALLLSQPITLVHDNGQHDRDVEALYARAFGPGRFAKAAARLREGNEYCHDLSFLAFENGYVIGACRLWPVTALNGVAALFLGPIAVDADAQHSGVGKRLVQACLGQVDDSEGKTVILVGEHSFFSPLGFVIIPQNAVIMPGPVDPTRVLWRPSVWGDNHAPRGRLPEGRLPQGRLSVPRATTPAD